MSAGSRVRQGVVTKDDLVESLPRSDRMRTRLLYHDEIRSVEGSGALPPSSPFGRFTLIPHLRR